jgi:hypothetical protein
VETGREEILSLVCLLWLFVIVSRWSSSAMVMVVRRDCCQSWSSSRRRRPTWSCRGGPTWWLSSRSVVVIVFASWLSIILLSMGGGLGALAAIVSLGVVKQEGLEGTYQWGDVVERKKER